MSISHKLLLSHNIKTSITYSLDDYKTEILEKIKYIKV